MSALPSCFSFNGDEGGDPDEPEVPKELESGGGRVSTVCGVGCTHVGVMKQQRVVGVFDWMISKAYNSEETHANIDLPGITSAGQMVIMNASQLSQAS